MTFDVSSIPLNLLLYAVSGIVLILIVLIVHLEVRVHRLLVGKNAKSLEDTVLHIKKGLEEGEEFQREMEKYLTLVERRLARSTRAVETVRFNAFKGIGAGGNMSFATAYLNEKGDGVVISTLNARERLGIFAKPLKNFTSEFELSPEEEEAISKAKHALTIQ